MPVIVVGCSGSVACIKIPLIIEGLQAVFPTHKIILIPTKRAWYFLPKTTDNHLDLSALSRVIDSLIVMDPFTDLSANLWPAGIHASDVEAFLITPIGANLMAKLARQSCHQESSVPLSNLEILLAGFLDSRSNRPFIMAPAMNQAMWNSGLTKDQLAEFNKLFGQGRLFYIVPTIKKASMCGEIGFGCMANPETIVEQTDNAIRLGRCDTVPTDVIDIPVGIFDAAVKIPHNALPSANSVPTLNFASSLDAELSYGDCLQRMQLFCPPVLAGHLNILVGLCDQRPVNCSMSSSAIVEICRQFCDDLSSSTATSGLLRLLSVKLAVDRESQVVISSDHGDGLVGRCEVFTDRDEWDMWKQRNDPVLHIVLRQWADALLLLNPTTEFLDKILSGICDDLLSCVIRAWDYRKALFVVYTIHCGNADQWDQNRFAMHRKLEMAGISVIWNVC